MTRRAQEKGRWIDVTRKRARRRSTLIATLSRATIRPGTTWTPGTPQTNLLALGYANTSTCFIRCLLPHLSADRFVTSGSLMPSEPAVGVGSPSSPSGLGIPTSSSISWRLSETGTGVGKQASERGRRGKVSNHKHTVRYSQRAGSVVASWSRKRKGLGPPASSWTRKGTRPGHKTYFVLVIPSPMTTGTRDGGRPCTTRCGTHFINRMSASKRHPETSLRDLMLVGWDLVLVVDMAF